MRPLRALLPFALGVLIALPVATATAPARAEVTSSGPTGFIIRIDLPVAARPDALYARFTEVGSWWNPEHSYSGSASNLSLEPRAGGCFCEKLKDGSIFRHLDVASARPGKAVRLNGALGPLKNLGASGAMDVQFKPDGAGSRLLVTYTVSGFASPKDSETMGPAVDGVLKEQFTRLKKLAETGNPTG